jgi:hypothetical protein
VEPVNREFQDCTRNQIVQQKIKKTLGYYRHCLDCFCPLFFESREEKTLKDF